MATAISHQEPVATSAKPSIVGSSSTRKSNEIKFNPREHLIAEMPEVIMMKDIGYAEDTGISPVAVSQPFRLFSTSAIEKFREECLSDAVYEGYRYESVLSPCQLRGFVNKHAPFVYDAWNHPATLAHISKIAGVDLIPNMDFETAHINLSVKSAAEAGAELAGAASAADDDKPIVGWHVDSYPFVCVTMLSDCTNMIGGETALRTANGEVMRVRGPGMGCAVVLQGRYITHQALRALGAQERITMVTSFRPKSPFLPDDSVLTTVRGISDLSELYYGFGRYRLEMLEERIRAQLAALRQRHAAGRRTDTAALKRFLADSIAFLEHTDREMVPEDQVIPGHQPDLGIPDVQISAAAAPKKKESKL